jgi:hypothetical protein
MGEGYPVRGSQGEGSATDLASVAGNMTNASNDRSRGFTLRMCCVQENFAAVVPRLGKRSRAEMFDGS